MEMGAEQDGSVELKVDLGGSPEGISTRPMRYVLEKTFTFEAMHVLEGHDGKCARPHGHSYSMTVAVGFDGLQKSGPKRNMAMDFGEISLLVKPLVEQYLDHQSLNVTLETDSPTAEYIASWAFEKLEKKTPNLEAVTVRETATSSVTIRRQPPPSISCEHCLKRQNNNNCVDVNNTSKR